MIEMTHEGNKTFIALPCLSRLDRMGGASQRGSSRSGGRFRERDGVRNV
jgi:hypothetical protein